MRRYCKGKGIDKGGREGWRQMKSQRKSKREKKEVRKGEREWVGIQYIRNIGMDLGVIGR